MHDCHILPKFSTPYQLLLIRGQLLIGVNRQQENLYQHEKRDQKQTRHGGTLRIHVCRVGRKVGRAAVHERKYSPFPRVGQGPPFL